MCATGSSKQQKEIRKAKQELDTRDIRNPQKRSLPAKATVRLGRELGRKLPLKTQVNT